LEDQLSTFAGLVSEAIVHAMVVDGWDAARPLITRAFRGTGRADQFGGLMDADREAVRQGAVPAEVAAGRWQGRLESAMIQDPQLIVELQTLIAELRKQGVRHPAPTSLAMGPTRGTAVQAGRDIVRSGNRSHYGGILIVVAVVAVLLIVGAGTVNTFILPALRDGGAAITAQTPCRDYLRAPQNEREQAVQRIAVEQNVSGAGSPFLILNVDGQCGDALDSSVGTVVARQQY
jgi:hypothetical protein